jgi:hypothetical protein
MQHDPTCVRRETLVGISERMLEVLNRFVADPDYRLEGLLSPL